MKDDSWGFSSTGDFWDIWSTAYDYIAKNGSMLKMNDSELYMNARLSPLSLTYYARCLAKGNYTVKLHFAEIIFRDNRSFFSVGRRIFDVYIQEELVLKDFDIEKEAQGVDKAIRFYWAGKGTKDVPKRGTYGPLISAISIKSGK
ncbi:probable leucine-rich repeat receptor-like serine/threonine-protein kinase At3g14840 isoform X2 [Fagus crenata]